MATVSIVPVIQRAVVGQKTGVNKKAPKGHPCPPKTKIGNAASHRASSNLAIAPSKGLKVGGSQSPTKRK